MSAPEEWIDRESDPTWPRGLTAAHVAADNDHEAVGVSDFGDDIHDHCNVCGLATTSDGKHHGWDES
jgi:hypothetical protein